MVQRSLALVALLEVGAIVPMIAVWGLTQLVDLRVLIAALLLRSPIALLHLRSLLRPVADWERAGDGADDATLLAADAATQELFRRFRAPYALGWALALALPVILAMRGIPEPVALARAELVIAVTLTVLSTIINPVLLLPFFRRIADRVMTRLGPQLQARGLEPQRPALSFSRDITVTAITIAFACLTGFGSLTLRVHVDSVRQQTIHELRAQVVEAAPFVIGDAAPHDPSLRVVSTEELPAVLTDELTREDSELVGAFDHGVELALAATAVGDGRWLVAEARPKERLLVTTAFGLLFIAFILGLVSAMMSTLGRSISEPLSELDAATLQVVEHGELRARDRVIVRRNDELGALARNFNGMIDMFRELAGAAQTVAAGNLDVNLERPGDLHDAFRAMLAQLNTVVDQLRGTALELSSVSAEILASMQEQERGAEKVSGAVDETSAAVSGLAATAEQISAAATDVRDYAEQSAATVDEMVTRINALNQKAGGVGELLDLIREVAERSDLLALNGSLEATRAGEAGRGFAIVAAEMRRLAERVSGTVDTVREQVAEIAAAGAITVTSTDRSRELAKDTAEAARSISSLTRDQDDKSKQASETARTMADFVGASVANVTQIRAAAESLQVRVHELEKLTGQFETRAGESMYAGRLIL